MLVQEGVCKDMKSVFKRFLTGKKPGGVGGKWAEYDEVISWIHAAGGKAVLAPLAGFTPLVARRY